MNQPASADALEGAAYDGYDEDLDGAEAPMDEMSAASDEFSGDDALGDEAFAAEDTADAASSWEGADDAMDAGEQDGFDAGAWQAFEAELADALDEGEGDEFIGRLLGGLTRVARQLPQRAAAVARRAPLNQAAQRLAQLVAPRAPVGGQGPGGPGIAALLGQLMGQGADAFDGFDAMADAYEDGVDEALPAIVGLAARGLARGLGHRSVGQLGQAARRALVRGVATAARTLVNTHGPRGARALGRLSAMTGRAARRAALPPQQAARQASRVLPRAARRVAQQAGTVRRLARPLAPAVAPRIGTAGPGSTGPGSIGAGEPVRHAPTTRVLRLHGPVEIVIRQR